MRPPRRRHSIYHRANDALEKVWSVYQQAKELTVQRMMQVDFQSLTS